MKKNYFNVYDIKLTTLTPVHIGSKENLDFTQIVIDIENKRLYCFNVFELISMLDPHEIKKLDDITKHDSPITLVRLQKFYQGDLLEKIKKIARYSFSIPGEVVEIYNRVLKISDENQVYKQFNSLRINLLQRETYSGNPFIPGSSLKGALRTGYLEKVYSNLQSKNPERVKPIKDLVDKITDENSYKEYKNKAFEKLEEIVLRNGKRGVQFDPFKTIKLSDLISFEKVHTNIIFAINVKKHDQTPTRSLHVPMEIIPPGAIFRGTMSIHTSPDNEVKSIDLGLLILGNKIHYQAVKEEEEKLLPHFKALFIERTEPYKDAINHNKAILIKIGHHSGSSAVTIKDLRKILVRSKGGKKVIKDSATTFWVASPSKTNLSKAEPFGWAILEFLNL